MFTGIVETLSRIAVRQDKGGDARLCIAPGGIDLAGLRPGDSIAVNGVCLTVTAIDSGGFWVDVSAETLSCTTLANLIAQSPVNLEQAVTPSTRLGGHLVSGHVDGVGRVLSVTPRGDSRTVEIEVPDALAKYVAPKGSVCVDGVSLTVNQVSGARFNVNIIPHTWDVTTFHQLSAGSRVNIEVDVVARYLERLIANTRG